MLWMIGAGLAAPIQLGLSTQLHAVLDPTRPPVIKAYSTGISQLELWIHRVDPEDLANFEAPRHNTLELRGEECIHRSVRVRPGGEVQTTPIDLSHCLRRGHGQLLVTVRTGDGGRVHQSWVQATRIGLAAFVHRQRLHVSTTDLRTGQPLAGVQLTNGTAAATTDDDGLAVLPSSGTLVARLGADRAVLDPPGLVWSGFDTPRSDAWFVFDGQQAYRPGDRVHLGGLVRSVSEGALQPFTHADTVRWELHTNETLVLPNGTRSTGAVIDEGSTPLGPDGTFEVGFDLPDPFRADVELSLSAGNAYQSHRISPSPELVARPERARCALQHHENHVALHPDRALYRPGETAVVEVASPFAPAWGTLTLFTGSWVQQRRIRLEERTQSLSFPVPDVGVEGELQVLVELSGQASVELDATPRVAHAMGWEHLPVDDPSHRLRVELETHTGLAPARRGVEVEVQVYEAGGEPARGTRVAIWAVEARGPALDVRSTDPMDLYRRREAGVFLPPYRPPFHIQLREQTPAEAFDLRPLATLTGPSVRPPWPERPPVRPSEHPPGPPTANPSSIEVVPDDLVHWESWRTTDANGLVRSAFTLPADGVGYRVLAVVAHGDRVGSAKATLELPAGDQDDEESGLKPP